MAAHNEAVNDAAWTGCIAAAGMESKGAFQGLLYAPLNQCETCVTIPGLTGEEAIPIIRGAKFIGRSTIASTPCRFRAPLSEVLERQPDLSCQDAEDMD